MHLEILSPNFPPSAGGSAVWSSLLQRHLTRIRPDWTISVVTERHPERPPVSGVVSALPFRAGRTDAPPLATVGRYTLEQLALGRHSLFSRADVRLLHASFAYKPGLVQAVAREARRGPRVIVDVRDRLFTAAAARRTAKVSAFVGCTEEVVASTEALTGRAVEYIPIPFEVPEPLGSSDLARRLETLGLASQRRYALATNGIQHAKGIIESLDVAQGLHASGLIDCLVIVGRNRDRISHPMLEREGAVHILGTVERSHALALIQNAAVVLVLSSVESPSRAALEALALHGRVVLPAGVQAFQKQCPALVAHRGASVEDIVQIGERAMSGAPPAPYDFSPHEPTAVAEEYATLVERVAAGCS